MTNQKFKKELNFLGAKAKEAKEFLLNSSVDTRNDALKFACEEIHKNRSDLFKENEKPKCILSLVCFLCFFSLKTKKNTSSYLAPWTLKNL